MANKDKHPEMYEAFGKKLEQELLKLCTEKGLLDGKLLESIDITDRWDSALAREFSADAVREYNNYPEATLSWAAYLGMAVAMQWDTDWQRYKDAPYSSYYGKAGFDDMDEHITRDILKMPLNSARAAKLADDLQSCAASAMSLIRHEGIEFQSIDAYYILLKCLGVMYSIGAAIALKAAGYSLVRVN